MTTPFDSTFLILVSASMLAISGAPAILLGGTAIGQRLSALLAVLAALLGEFSSLSQLSGLPSATYSIEWPLPFGPAVLSVDKLSLLFLLPLFLVTGCVAVYSLAYWPARKQAGSTGLTLFIGLFAAAMVVVVSARSGVLFLMAWEVMALSAYFLLTTDQQNPDVQKSGMVYLLAAHFGTMALFVVFALLRSESGAFAFPPIHSLSHLSPSATIIMLAALIGFGGKAGLMPLHFWLPGAHANAPSHVSAMMSGLMLKMGIYGILRVLSFFDVLPEWLGWLILILGSWSAVNGIAMASGQRDLKKLLACSSIENVGIIFIGIGMGLVGMQLHSPTLLICGFAGAYIHIINHALFKSLMFMGSGVIIHGAGTRKIDLLGGLARRMPATSPLMLIGSLAICGLPPLNGFIGELFLYIGAINDGISNPLPLAALAAPVLALTGGLAIITFVKLYGIVFLGSPRSDASAHAHEASPLMTGSMAILAFTCLLFGTVPLIPVQLVTPIVSAFGSPGGDTTALIAGQVHLAPLMITNLLLVVLVAVIWLCYFRKLNRSPRNSGATWCCGYPATSPRMQYTGTSFSELIVSQFGVWVSPRRTRPDMRGEILPKRAAFSYESTETVLYQIVTPVFQWTGWAFSYLRRVQHGQLHIYMLYIFATLFILMVWPH